MSRTKPVPSYSALQALRQLVFGTSCTVAVGVGVLVTEERRRGITFLTKVRDNGNKLKAIRSLHAQGPSIQKDHELCDSDIFASAQDGESAQQNGNFQTPSTIDTAKESQRGQAPCRLRKVHVRRGRLELQHARDDGKDELDLPLSKIHSNIDDLVNGQPVNDEFVLKTIEDLKKGWLDPESQTLWRAVRTSRACQRRSDFDDCTKILLHALQNGHVPTQHFRAFQPESAIATLLGVRKTSTGLYKFTVPNPEKLDAAASICMANVPGGAQISQSMIEYAHILCEQACFQKKYDLCIKIYYFLKQCGDHGDAQRSAPSAIIAFHHTGQHYAAVSHFINFYQLQERWSSVVSVVDMILKSMHLISVDFSRQLILKMSSLAEARLEKMPPTWILQVMTHHRKLHRQLTSLEDLFEVMRPHFQWMKLPQLAYNLMMHFHCVNNDVKAAQAYYAEFRAAYPYETPHIDMIGNLARIQAMLGDWEEVERLFLSLQDQGQTSRTWEAHYGSIFVPILSTYTQRHTLMETEEFLQRYIEQYRLPLTYYLVVFMLDLYGKNKEMESMGRWVNYVVRKSPKLFDAGCVVTILNHCRKKWHLNFEQLSYLHRRFGELTCAKELRLVNHDTNDYVASMMTHRATGTTNVVERTCNGRVDLGGKYVLTDAAAVERSMLLALTLQRPADVLDLWQLAKDEHVPLGENVFVPIIKASLAIKGNEMTPTIKLLEQIDRRSIVMRKCLNAILIHQLKICSQRQSDDNAGKLIALREVEHSVYMLRQQGYPIAIQLINQLTLSMAHCGEYRAAIDLWKSQAPTTEDFKIEHGGLLACLRCYLGLRNVLGIKWVLKMMEEHNIAPSEMWYNHLRLAISESAFLRADDAAFVKTVQAAIAQVQQKRSEVAEDKVTIIRRSLEIMHDAINEIAASRSMPRLPLPAIQVNVDTGHQRNHSQGMWKSKQKPHGAPWSVNRNI